MGLSGEQVADRGRPLSQRLWPGAANLRGLPQATLGPSRVQGFRGLEFRV